MKAFIKYSLILFTFISYFSASSELCETEKQQNYEKETHIYLNAERDSQTVTLKTVKQLDDFFLLSDFYHHGFVSSVNNNHSRFSLYRDFPPPKLNKLYLYNSVFLV